MVPLFSGDNLFRNVIDANTDVNVDVNVDVTVVNVDITIVNVDFATVNNNNSNAYAERFSTMTVFMCECQTECAKRAARKLFAAWHSMMRGCSSTS